jgi:hypothetical protein
MQFLRWQVISAFDIFFELALVVMSIYIVWDLQAALGMKVTVVFAFSMRLPYVVVHPYPIHALTFYAA